MLQIWRSVTKQHDTVFETRVLMDTSEPMWVSIAEKVFKARGQRSMWWTDQLTLQWRKRTFLRCGVEAYLFNVKSSYRHLSPTVAACTDTEQCLRLSRMTDPRQASLWHLYYCQTSMFVVDYDFEAFHEPCCWMVVSSRVQNNITFDTWWRSCSRQCADLFDEWRPLDWYRAVAVETGCHMVH